jgi:hypothetical protein
MKATYINISCLLSMLILFSINSFSQAGNFEVRNDTDCDVDVQLHHGTGSCSSYTCTGQKIGGMTAYANTTTTVHNGSGIAVWLDIDIVMASGICFEYDGLCNGSGSTAVCDCDGNDIAVTWIDCNHATITVE